MKKCSYCGQEITRDATTCRFCHRAQPPVAPVPRPWARRAPPKRLPVMLMAAGGVVLMTMFAQRQPQSTFEERPTPRLEVYGKRGLTGVEIVNHESEPVSACIITLQDDWRAMVQTLKPKETRLLPWSEFRSPAGNELQAIDGERARYASITCDSHRQTRRGAALAFR